jgi:hypothetical protein
VRNGGAAREPADPTGKSTKPVQPPLQKYSDFPKTQISVELPPSTPLEGRIAIVTDAGLDAMDAAALLTKSANADGKTVWS